MSDPGRNAAGVSTACVKAPRPASQDSISDDPPPYSACVPYPPPIYPNCPETNSSLVDNPPVYPGSEIPNRGIQTGNYLHEGRPSAPFLDVPSTSEDPAGVHEPRVTLYNGRPECKLSCTATQRNPTTYRLERKTILHIRRGGKASITCRLVWLATAILVCIVIPGLRSQFNKTRKTHYHDIPDIYEETKIKSVYKDDSHGTFDFGDGTKIDMFDFDKMRRAMNKSLHTILNRMRSGKNNETDSNNVRDVKSREADVDTNLHHVCDCVLKKSGKEEDDDDSSESNFEPKYLDFPDELNPRSSKFGDERNDDADRAMNFKRIADRFEDILGIPRKEKTNENVVQKSASDHD